MEQPAAKRRRTAQCGVCQACVRDDCGAHPRRAARSTWMHAIRAGVQVDGVGPGGGGVRYSLLSELNFARFQFNWKNLVVRIKSQQRQLSLRFMAPEPRPPDPGPTLRNAPRSNHPTGDTSYHLEVVLLVPVPL